MRFLEGLKEYLSPSRQDRQATTRNTETLVGSQRPLRSIGRQHSVSIFALGQKKALGRR
jgi:hypothetical protein